MLIIIPQLSLNLIFYAFSFHFNHAPSTPPTLGKSHLLSLPSLNLQSSLFLTFPLPPTSVTCISLKDLTQARKHKLISILLKLFLSFFEVIAFQWGRKQHRSFAGKKRKLAFVWSKKWIEIHEGTMKKKMMRVVDYPRLHAPPSPVPPWKWNEGTKKQLQKQEGNWKEHFLSGKAFGG